MSDDQRPDEPQADPRSDQVGSVGEEAAKLFGAISDWADQQGTGLAGLAGQAAAAAREVEEHLTAEAGATATQCSYCPICRTVHAVRQTSPEVRSHLANAASSLLQAAAGMLATTVPPERRTGPGGAGQPRPPASGGVQHIDLDEDWPEDEG
ncbi:hypothetical protein [Nocardioides sp. SYSU DS0663]|uniref:hypothetical protein n=1 Tax=Nocardioides sp. SYSU DS0663 TaxID=3416445 RepID=UPI003F4B10A8